jgi:CRP-like cAMP-binding protein
VSPTDPRRLLDRLPILEGVPGPARDRLAAAARPAAYAAGAPIFRRGEAGEGMLLVLDGLVRLHLASAAGRELTLGLAGPGEPVGEIALIDSGPRSADATAPPPVRTLLFRHADAAAIIASDATVAGALLHLAEADPSGLVRLPQGQIAALVAASRPKVNAVLAEFRARGLVASARAGLRLTDPAALRLLGEAG